jgi:Uma2 family endonuclease
MPETLEQPATNAPPPVRVAWTRADCARFVEQGYLTPGQYELIEGDILRKMGQKRPHTAGVGRLFAWCISVFGGDFVQSQGVIDVAPEDNPTSEPEPDVFVLNRSTEHFTDAFPGPSDLTLVAEVSDTTLAFDLSTKAGLYARAGIAEYWVMDVTGRSLTVHRNPQSGRYQSVTRYAADETVTVAGRPDAPVVVSELLPPLPPRRG